MSEAPLLSIIIVSWNTRDLLRRCLESVRATVPPITYEVIVVDNASYDHSADMVAEEFPEFRLIRHTRNSGFSTGNNLGLSQASGRYMMLLNPDAELLPETARTLIGFMEANPQVGVVGPMLLNTDGSLQKNGRRFPSLFREVLGITRAYKLFWKRFDRTLEYGRSSFDEVAQVDEVCGACMLVRASALRDVGYLDQRFFMYYEEVDWCRRFKEFGWEVRYLPSARVIHHWAQGANQTGLAGSKTFYRSQYLYFMKHHGPFQAWTLRILSGLLLAVVSVKRRIKRRRKSPSAESAA